MLSLGYDDAARICLTHSFNTQEMHTYIGKFDIPDEQQHELERALQAARIDDYDRLIQLCDALSWGSGVCLMEKRLIDVLRRHGTAPLMQQKINATMEIFEYFQARIGKSIYSLFPEAIENTFN